MLPNNYHRRRLQYHQIYVVACGTRHIERSFTPLRPPFSTSLSLFAVIFRAAYQAGFEVYTILSLLAVTSSYGKHTVCLVRTVCTFSYFSYVGG